MNNAAIKAIRPVMQDVASKGRQRRKFNVTMQHYKIPLVIRRSKRNRKWCLENPWGEYRIHTDLFFAVERSLEELVMYQGKK